MHYHAVPQKKQAEQGEELKTNLMHVWESFMKPGQSPKNQLNSVENIRPTTQFLNRSLYR